MRYIKTNLLLLDPTYTVQLSVSLTDSMTGGMARHMIGRCIVLEQGFLTSSAVSDKRGFTIETMFGGLMSERLRTGGDCNGQRWSLCYSTHVSKY